MSHSRLNFQYMIKNDTGSGGLKDSKMCSQVKKYLKSVSLWVKNSVEVDMKKLRATLRAKLQKSFHY